MPALASPPVLAFASLSAKSLATVPDISVFHVFTQMIVAVIVIGGGIWLFGKMTARRRGRANRSDGILPARQLRVVSRAPLGKDQHLAVVHWGDREILIGISGGSVTLLSDAERGTTGSSPTTGGLAWNGTDETGALPGLNSVAGLFNSPRAMSDPTGARPQSLLNALRALTTRS